MSKSKGNTKQMPKSKEDNKENIRENKEGNAFLQSLKAHPVTELCKADNNKCGHLLLENFPKPTNLNCPFIISAHNDVLCFSNAASPQIIYDAVKQAIISLKPLGYKIISCKNNMYAIEFNAQGENYNENYVIAVIRNESSKNRQLDFIATNKLKSDSNLSKHLYLDESLTDDEVRELNKSKVPSYRCMPFGIYLENKYPYTDRTFKKYIAQTIWGTICRVNKCHLYTYPSRNNGKLVKDYMLMNTTCQCEECKERRKIYAMLEKLNFCPIDKDDINKDVKETEDDVKEEKNKEKEVDGCRDFLRLYKHTRGKCSTTSMRCSDRDSDYISMLADIEADNARIQLEMETRAANGIYELPALLD